MPPDQILARLIDHLNQCDDLITESHFRNEAGNYVFNVESRRKIAKTAIIELFIAWEAFLEDMIISIMIGNAPIGGNDVRRFVVPRDSIHAKSLVMGTQQKYFDYSNHENTLKICDNFFENGHPFSANIRSIHTDLSDLKKIRNACAHITSSTQAALEAVALRLFNAPRNGIQIYELVTAIHPPSGAGVTVFRRYRNIIEVTANMIANG
ncbi:hypothetical protein [Methylobacterium sp. CM6244]